MRLHAKRLDNAEHEIKELHLLPTDVKPRVTRGINGAEWSDLVLY